MRISTSPPPCVGEGQGGGVDERSGSAPAGAVPLGWPPLLRRLAGIVALGLLAGCGDGAPPPEAGPAFEPTEPQLLSTASPTKDEDPSVLRARDGTLYVAWFSDRGGNNDVYVTRTGDGKTWNPPVRVTTSPDGDFYPNLIQDEQGVFHLTWFRWHAFFRGHIFYNRSLDGLTWDQAAEVPVTTDASVDDWVPTITTAADGTLLVYFVSERRDAAHANQIYVSTRRPSVATWDPAVPAAGVNSPSEHDHLPFAARTGSEITLLWVRHDTTQALPYLNHKSDVFQASSPDGLSWSAPARITRETGNVVNLFPALYPSLEGRWSLVWLSTRLGPPTVFEIPLASASLYPQGVVANTLLPAGYSHRIAPTSTPGVYIGVWTQGPEGAQDIYYRFFRKG